MSKRGKTAPKGLGRNQMNMLREHNATTVQSPCAKKISVLKNMLKKQVDAKTAGSLIGKKAARMAESIQ